jgi:hypothetical protein
MLTTCSCPMRFFMPPSFRDGRRKPWLLPQVAIPLLSPAHAIYCTTTVHRRAYRRRPKMSSSSLSGSLTSASSQSLATDPFGVKSRCTAHAQAHALPQMLFCCLLGFQRQRLLRFEPDMPRHVHAPVCDARGSAFAWLYSRTQGGCVHARAYL